MIALLAVTRSASADDEPAPDRVDLPADEPAATKPGYTQLFASIMGGTGLRFNDPYRLPTPLGNDANSVSRSAAYIDLGFAMTLGNPLGYQNGGALRITTAVEGVGQVVLTPSYFGYRRWKSLAAYGRAGASMVLSPDVTWGIEGAVGGIFYLLGGIGVAAEIVGDVFYGAGTRDVATASYPMVSGQIGLVGSYEVLP